MATKLPDTVLKRKDMYLLDPSKVVIRAGWNPRKSFDSKEDAEFIQFVIDNGPRFPPIFIKRVGETIELVDGERRLKAVLGAVAAGCVIDGIPAVFVDKDANEIDQLSLALTANQGKPLTPMEEAEACRRLKAWGLDNTQIAVKIGKSPSHVTNRLVLINASPALAEAVESGTITQGEAMEVVKESEGSIEKQDEKLTRIKKPEAVRAPKMMSRLRLGKEIETMFNHAHEKGIKPSEMGDADIVGVLVGLIMVLKNMSKEEAEGTVFITFTEKAAAEAVGSGKPPWEV